MDNSTNSNNSKTVAIIGAGICGMTTCKACLEFDLKPTVFERTKFSCGLWRYRTEVEPGQASVMRTTIVNSSKEMTAFSDFPFPKEYPNFMPNEFMYEYLLNYAKSFNFDSHVQYEHEVLLVEHASEPLEGYQLTIKNLSTGQVQQKRFDAVAVCSGHNHTPFLPEFPDQNLFEGKILHSHSVRTNEQFRDKRLVVVGIGNSGGDVAADAAPIAKQVYLSSRKGGTWLIRRTGLNGRPIDTVNGRRLINSLLHLLPYSLRCSLVEFFMQRMIGHDLLGLRPENTRFFGQHAMVNDHIPTYLHLGWIKIRYSIERFTKNGVIFVGDNGRVTECDTVVMATGYKCDFPFLTPILPGGVSDGHLLKLYKHCFEPKQPQPERLIFIGLPKASGSLPPIAELQSRWFAMLLTQKCKPLPTQKKMFEQIKRIHKRIEFRFGKDNLNQFLYEVEMLKYCDSLARSSGLMPTISRYFFKDPKLWWALISKPTISAQYRLNGFGSKPEQSRELILTTMKRIKYPYKKTDLKNLDGDDDNTDHDDDDQIKSNGKLNGKLINGNNHINQKQSNGNAIITMEQEKLIKN